jgi:hypothetical protein
MSSRRYKGTVQEAMAAEDARVAALIARTKADRERELDRKAAEFQVASGQTVNIGEAVIEPTPEWMAQGESRTFTPRLEDGTVRTVKAHRRVVTLIIDRMHQKGKITDEQYDACRWYRINHEIAGLEGRVKTSNLSLAGGGSGGGGAQAPMALHESEALARQEFRAAREAMTSMYLRFFDAIVLGDIPISRSWVYSKSPKHKAEFRFRMIANELVVFCQRATVDMDVIGSETE